MRTITITCDCDGPEDRWTAQTGAFLAAIDADAAIDGRFTCQVAAAVNGKSRVHWGRWDRAETLAIVQSRAYFKTFAAGVKALIGHVPLSLGATVAGKTSGW